MQLPKVLSGFLAASVLCVCAAPLVFAQIRIQEPPDSLTNDRVQTLQQQVSALQQQVQQQSQIIGTLQQQVQSLLQDNDMLGGLIQSEKVNTANMIAMVESQVSQMPSQWGQAINQRVTPLEQRVAPLEQVLQVSAGGVTVRSTGSLNLEAQGEVKLVGTRLRGDVQIAEFSALVSAPTLQAQTVIASTYTPGAGNTW